MGVPINRSLIGLMRYSYVFVNWFFVVEDFAAFVAHVLTRFRWWCASTLNNLTHWFHLTQKTRCTRGINRCVLSSSYALILSVVSLSERLTGFDRLKGSWCRPNCLHKQLIHIRFNWLKVWRYTFTARASNRINLARQLIDFPGQRKARRKATIGRCLLQNRVTHFNSYLEALRLLILVMLICWRMLGQLPLKP